jgi:hypothetical protein
MSEHRHTRRSVTRRSVLQGGAVAAGVVWTTPIARSIHLVETPGSPPPTTTTEATVPTMHTTTTTEPHGGITLVPESACHLSGGPYDVRFRISGLTPGRSYGFQFTFTSGEYAPATVTRTGKADANGVFAYYHSFGKPWTALLALFDGEPTEHAEPLIAGSFAVQVQCSAGIFIPS